MTACDANVIVALAACFMGMVIGLGLGWRAASIRPTVVQIAVKSLDEIEGDVVAGNIGFTRDEFRGENFEWLLKAKLENLKNSLLAAAKDADF